MNSSMMNFRSVLTGMLLFACAAAACSRAEMGQSGCEGHDHASGDVKQAGHEYADEHGEHIDQEYADEHDGHAGHGHVADSDEHDGHECADDGHERADGHADHALETEDADHDDHGDHDEHADEDGLLHLSPVERELIGLEIASASSARIGRRLHLPGEIELNADRVVHVVPVVSGIVRDVRKGLGDVVEAGELMAILDCRELAEARAAYLEAFENLDLARGKFEREEKLQGRGISSEQEFLDARQAMASARIALRSAGQQLLALGESQESLSHMSERRDAAYAEHRLSAPIAGTVIAKHITLGEALEGGDEVFVLADLSSVWVRISVYQKDLPRVEKGLSVKLLDGEGRQLAEGVIDFLSPVLGERTRAATARVTLANPDGKLRPGTFVTAVVETERSEAAVAVPTAALQLLDGETVLFLPLDDAFEPRPVLTGRSDGELTEILGGLRPGESYVSHGAFELKAKLLTSNMDPHAGHGH